MSLQPLYDAILEANPNVYVLAAATTAILAIATILLTVIAESLIQWILRRRDQKLNAVASTDVADDQARTNVIAFPTRRQTPRTDAAEIDGHAWPAWGTEHWPQAR